MAFDIFNAPKSAIASGIEGKSICLYAGNKLGKTWVAAHFPKPFFFAFELGLEATSGVPYVYPNRWSIFLDALNQFVKDPGKAKEQFQCLVVDQLEAMYACCEKYVCMKAGVESIDQKPKLPNGKENGWWNGWSEVDREVNAVIDKFRFLLDKGFTFIYIAHEGSRVIPNPKGDFTKLYPRGNKRIIDPIVDLCSFIVYVKSNGTDETGKVIKSSAYLYDCDSYLAGGRFTTVEGYLPEFSAEALIHAIESATQNEAELVGQPFKTNEQIVKERTIDLPPYETIKTQITDLALAIYNFDDKHSRYGEAQTIIEKHLGKGKTISNDTTPEQVELLCVIYDDLHAFVEYDPQLCKLL